MTFEVKETSPCAAAKESYTYSDYEKWPDDQRWELIGGVPYDMTPAPSRRHQEILGELYLQFASYLKNKQCKVFIRNRQILPTWPYRVVYGIISSEY